MKTSGARVRRAVRPASVALALGLVLALSPSCRRDPPRPVLFVTVDALRADRVGAYGSRGLPTPAIDRFAREGALVEGAVAPMGRTTQAVGTLLTGLHPLAHGADGLGMTLPAGPPTLAERFRAAGYDTAAFASNVFLRPGLGFERGFGVFSNPKQRWDGDAAAALTDEALAWLRRAAQGDRPWFLWVHYLDPHWTYEPPAEFGTRADPDWNGPFDFFGRVAASRLSKGQAIFETDRILTAREIEHVQRLYDGEVAATDAAIAALWNGLESLGLADRAIVVFTADHGESLGEHRYWFAHGEYLYEPSLRVPLLVRAPGIVPAGTRVTGTVPTQDVAPTLLDLAGLPPFEAADGRSLAALLRAGGRQGAPPATTVHVADHILVHPENPRRPVAGRDGRWWALRDGNLKLLRIPQGDRRFAEELYDLAADPGETRDLAAARPADVARLREELLQQQRELMARWDKAKSADPQSVAEETLRSLGYVH